MTMIVSLRSPSSPRSPTGLFVFASVHAPLSEPVIRKFWACGSASGNASVVVGASGSVDTVPSTTVDSLESDVVPGVSIEMPGGCTLGGASMAAVFLVSVSSRWPITSTPAPTKQARATTRLNTSSTKWIAGCR